MFLLLAEIKVRAQEWQWSVVIDKVSSNENHDHPRAFLWIPPGCKQVRGVVVGQHNMLEERIFEHNDFRRALAAINFSKVWVTPGPDLIFNFNKGAGEHFNYMIQKQGNASGYTELEFAPIVPIGHSATASYPWNFAAWNLARTLAILPVHGDAPLTNLKVSGEANH